jgi:ABC-2 type transport system ATP-binding protein
MDLRIEGLSKTYANGVKALDGVSLTIPRGMYGLLGPNGAGKSTLMRILATLQEADTGQARLGDIDVLHQKDEVRQRLGYLPQDFGVYPRVSCLDMLDHLALLKGFTDRKGRNALVEALLNRANLYQVRKKSLASFSGGMLQRFGIIQALIGNPELLIVDEPTAGLDPSERNRFYNLLAEIGEEVIVILSTHIVDDVRELCPNMAIIHEGHVLYAGATTAALGALSGKVWRKSISKSAAKDHAERYRVISSKMVGGHPLIHVLSASDPGDGFQPIEADLEDVFFATTAGLN